MENKKSFRSDKKRDVKVTVHTEFKESIYRLSFVTGNSVMVVVEDLLLFAMRSKRILEELSPYIVRSIKIDNVLYVGHENAKRFSPTPIKSLNYVRVKTRLKRNDYHVLATIAYGLDVKNARACAILINESFHNQLFLDNYIEKYLSKNITDEQLLQLKRIIEYVNRDANYNLNWGNLLDYIMREIKEPLESVKEKVDSFIINHWKNK